MKPLMPRSLLMLTALALSGGATLFAQTGPCALLTNAEALTHIARGKPTHDQTPEVTVVGGGSGSLCQYPIGGQLGIWRAPNAEANFERFLQAWKVDKATRHPVAGVGDRAWIMFPAPENEDQDRAAYLVAHVGQQIVTVALFAHDGQADGMMGRVCRGDQSRMTPREKADCTKILADTSETQEPLQPAVIELAKLVVARVRAGRGS